MYRGVVDGKRDEMKGNRKFLWLIVDGSMVYGILVHWVAKRRWKCYSLGDSKSIIETFYVSCEVE